MPGRGCARQEDAGVGIVLSFTATIKVPPSIAEEEALVNMAGVGCSSRKEGET
jgi:hypothetical protein